jgi:hypothetical protein
MTIKFICEHCRKEVKAPDESAGRRGKCPYCGESSYIPDPKAAEEGEIPLAPVDESEEQQMRKELEELRQRERELLSELGPGEDARSGSGASDSSGGEKRRTDFQPEDCYPLVVSYCVDMTNSRLERAEEHLKKLKPYGYTAIQAVEDFLQGRAESDTISSIPAKLRQGFLKQLKAELRKSTG